MDNENNPRYQDTPERDAFFAPGNDRIWGEGNWVKCYICPLDLYDNPTYHHKGFHSYLSS